MQTKLQSFIETKTNMITGIGINYVANIYILPKFFGVSLTISEYTELTLIYTVLSFIRHYVLRRIFNWYNTRRNNANIES